jgi:isopropylmalate/homocitrate/citramalate synthase
MNSRADDRAPTVETMPDVTVREVGPRDGLQMIADVMPTAEKMRWIQSVVDAGIREMEVTSFVPAAILPQFCDAAQVMATVRITHNALRAIALVPNMRGIQSAVQAGATVVLIPVSASEAHSQANVRKSTQQQIEAVARIVAWAKTLSRPPCIEAAISTAFGCSLQGVVAERDVLSIAVELAKAGVDKVMLADTLGYASPSQVRGLVRGVRNEIGEQMLGNLHLHDTLGLALANVYAGLEEGVRGFDSALGGLGGCPFAPGSVGNLNTEDLVYLLESEGLDTGIDLWRLLEARDLLRQALPRAQLHGRVAPSGIPITFVPARAAVYRTVKHESSNS